MPKTIDFQKRLYPCWKAKALGHLSNHCPIAEICNHPQLLPPLFSLPLFCIKINNCYSFQFFLAEYSTCQVLVRSDMASQLFDRGLIFVDQVDTLVLTCKVVRGKKIMVTWCAMCRTTTSARILTLLWTRKPNIFFYPTHAPVCLDKVNVTSSRIIGY